MTERPVSSGAMAADSPAMPLPTTSTSTSDEKLTSGLSKTRGPSSSVGAAGASGDGTAPDEQATKPPPAATTAPAPTSLKNARRSMRRRLL